MADETRSEQLNQKITPSARKKLDDILRKMGYPADSDGHVRWDQDKLLDVLGIVESTLVLDEHENYAEVVAAINQYTSLINSKLISLISDLDTSEARIRSEYEKKLASKDQTIRDLQEQRSIQETEKKSALEDATKFKDAQTIAEKHLIDAEDRLKKAEDTIKDKDSIIQMLTTKLKESEEKLSGYDTLRASEASLREQVTLILHQKELAEADIKHVNENLNSIKTAFEKAEEELLSKTDEIEALKEKNQSLQRDLSEEQRFNKQKLEEQKVLAEQNKEFAVERAVANAQREMREELDQLRAEKIRLEVQLEILQANNEEK